MEIGCGKSTKTILRGIQKNKEEGNETKFTGIEPYPDQETRGIHSPGFNLIQESIQKVPLSVFSDADLLFIDSSHVSKIGSDVNYEILEIIPTLKVGALVHWHDIVMPSEYFRSWVMDMGMFWNESYLVQSFMMFNKSFQIIWASQYLQLKHSQALKESFDFYQPNNDTLTSFWIQRVA